MISLFRNRLSEVYIGRIVNPMSQIWMAFTVFQLSFRNSISSEHEAPIITTTVITQIGLSVPILF